MKQNKINHLQNLLIEKSRLQSVIKTQETELKNGVEYFQSNYKSIVWERINPFKGNVTANGIVNFLATDVLPLVTGIGGKKEASTISKLLAKGIRYALLTAGIGLVKKMGADKKASK
jgi:hypothetical protein